jgi:hypothetical protein
MEEVLPGVHHWTAEHPRIHARVSSHFLTGSATLIDPLLPDGGMEWLEDHPPQRIVLSNRHHLRHSEHIAEAFGCPILCHESGLHEFEGGPAVEGFAFGDRLADDVVAVEMDAICPDDTVLEVEAGDGALLFADSLIHHDEVRFVSDGLIGDDPESVKATIRERARSLLDRPCENLLFAHGDPMIGGGAEALRAIAEGG